MRDVILLSCFKSKLGKKSYTDGDQVILPFTGVYSGKHIKSVELKVNNGFIVPKNETLCICKITIIEFEKSKIIGKLNSIEFL